MAYINGNKIMNIDFTGIVNVDHEYNPKSENPQSGKAVAEALLTVGGGDITIDHTYDRKSENPQSGKAVHQAIRGSIDTNYNPKSNLAQSGTAVAEAIGDIETVLDELHNYAQALINGGAE